MLAALREALATGDRLALVALHDEQVAWLATDGILRGAEAAADRLLTLAATAHSWADPQQSGAKAVLRWQGPAGPGALVVELRRGVVVFAAEAP